MPERKQLSATKFQIRAQCTHLHQVLCGVRIEFLRLNLLDLCHFARRMSLKGFYKLEELREDEQQSKDVRTRKDDVENYRQQQLDLLVT